jgi:hypothetical protein
MEYRAGQGVTVNIKVAVIDGKDVKTSVVGFIRHVLTDNDGATWLEIYGINNPILLNEVVEVDIHG